ncbi:hypothetical protein ACIBTZ_30585 [Micromonospora sp. NPDC049460]|uniref:hypothetical protein n=1 Tax=Micromonospora sp. NPDC049460 TaxID=3364272 RepID=UPI0037BDE714
MNIDSHVRFGQPSPPPPCRRRPSALPAEIRPRPIVIIVGVLAGTAASVLTWLAGHKPSAAIVVGGGCFITVVTCLMTVAGFLTG